MSYNLKNISPNIVARKNAGFVTTKSTLIDLYIKLKKLFENSS